jgi:hypothetical protein
MMEAVRISETSVYVHDTARPYILGSCHLYTRCRENSLGCVNLYCSCRWGGAMSLNWPLLIPHIMYEYGEPGWNDIDMLESKNSERTCPNATLSTTNPTWITPGANPGLRNKRQATNRLSYGTAFDAGMSDNATWHGPDIDS